jgi:hypothetical protein
MACSPFRIRFSKARSGRRQWGRAVDDDEASVGHVPTRTRVTQGAGWSSGSSWWCRTGRGVGRSPGQGGLELCPQAWGEDLAGAGDQGRHLVADSAHVAGGGGQHGQGRSSGRRPGSGWPPRGDGGQLVGHRPVQALGDRDRQAVGRHHHGVGDTGVRLAKLPMSQLRSRASALSCGMGAPGAAVACGHGQAVGGTVVAGRMRTVGDHTAALATASAAGSILRVSLHSADSRIGKAS